MSATPLRASPYLSGYASLAAFPSPVHASRSPLSCARSSASFPGLVMTGVVAGGASCDVAWQDDRVETVGARGAVFSLFLVFLTHFAALLGTSMAFPCIFDRLLYSRAFAEQNEP